MHALSPHPDTVGSCMHGGSCREYSESCNGMHGPSCVYSGTPIYNGHHWGFNIIMFDVAFVESFYCL